MDEFTVSNDLLENPAGLRTRAGNDGYLFFRGLIDPRELFTVRHQILNICEEEGWLKPGTDADDGIAAAGVRHIEGEPEFGRIYERVQKLESFHSLAHSAPLIAMLDSLFGEPTLVHARNIARIIFPQAAQFTTPAHQDHIHIGGTEETWTSWLPLGDCPQQLGSLAVLSGSHKDGLFPVHKALGAGGVGIDTDNFPFTWVASDFQAGDALFFHSLLVHKGLPNITKDRLRLSVDYRYQGVSQPVARASLEPHGVGLTWDEIYSGWQSDRCQYYWKEPPPRIAG